VREIISEYYRIVECNVLESDYTAAVKGEKKGKAGGIKDIIKRLLRGSAKPAKKRAHGYRHVIGHLRDRQDVLK
jgi:hypothetical protein